MNEEQRNLFLAIVLTFVILFGSQYFFKGAPDDAGQGGLDSNTADSLAPVARGTTPQNPVPGATEPAPPQLVAPESRAVFRDRPELLAISPRVAIASDRIRGSIPLRGRRIDDLILADYRETTARDSPNIVLLSPDGGASPYYAEFGWSTVPGSGIRVPDKDSMWQTTGGPLSTGHPVTLSWDNGAGLLFERHIAIDENFMMTITQRVSNRGPAAVSLSPFGLIARIGTPKVTGFAILHEGALGAFDKTLDEVSYKDMKEEKRIEHQSTGGWIGFTDKYWLTALIPDQSTAFTGHFTYGTASGRDYYQSDYILPPTVIAGGASAETVSHFFAGAKEVNVIDHYMESLGIARFDRAIDWGWLFWLTEPIFQALQAINSVIGNFGLSILALTVIIKLLFFPLANKSYVSMSRMKTLQPKMKALQERFKDDKVKLQQETMALYKKEKVNPLAGCLPMVVQIPVFFALYKVLFITIEMRQTPFFGWVRDLSAPDPMLVLNLFGLIPWDPPGFLAIGVWPLLMGLSMFLQQRLNPQPADATQAKIFMLMPVVFTFMLARFPVGLVIYWTWNNILSMAQQWMIMKREGAVR